MDRKTAREKIRLALIQAIQNTGNRGFGYSQSKCPVETGTLKRSGSVKKIDNGITITYSAQYASFVEQGFSAGTVYAKAHVRAGHQVKGYSYYTKGSTGGHFIEGGLTEAFDTLAQDFETNLHGFFVRIQK